MNLKRLALSIVLAAGVIPGLVYASPPRPEASDTDVINVPTFNMPMSGYMSKESKDKLKERVSNPFPATSKITPDNIKDLRESFDRNIFKKQIEDARVKYPVKIREERIGGVVCDIIEPLGGVMSKNKERVLINIHGGGFIVGSRSQALLESIPVSAVGGFRVISIDYRMAPEHKFPAGAEDVEAVYKEIIREYRPDSVGIYGVSAGGFLTAQVVARFLDRKLPLPGAIGIGSAGLELSGAVGDAEILAAALAPVQAGVDVSMLAKLAVKGGAKRERPYFEGLDLSDWRISPGLHPDVLAKFPPTILVAGSRDWLLSRTTTGHLALRKAGAKAELYVWEGMWHGWTSEVNLPEAQEYFDVMSRFFDDNLT